ncbi:hypothetical protein THAOC_22505, partial [Thalassiosira oceanica]
GGADEKKAEAEKAGGTPGGSRRRLAPPGGRGREARTASSWTSSSAVRRGDEIAGDPHPRRPAKNDRRRGERTGRDAERGRRGGERRVERGGGNAEDVPDGGDRGPPLTGWTGERSGSVRRATSRGGGGGRAPPLESPVWRATDERWAARTETILIPRKR